MQKRYRAASAFSANYTWSKSIDYSSFGSIEGNQTGPDPFNTRNNRGPSDFDVSASTGGLGNLGDAAAEQNPDG